MNDGHLNFLSEELACIELLCEFDSLFTQSIMTDALFEKALHKIVFTHTQGILSSCTACEPVINFLPILLTGKAGEIDTEVAVVDTAEQMMFDELAAILELPSEAWLSMPSENTERSVYMSNYIGFVLSGDAAYDEKKYDEYSEAGIKFVRNVSTTDARYEEVRAQADKVRIAQLGKHGAMPDLNYRTLGSFKTDQGDVYQVNEQLLRMIALRIKEKEGDPLLAREIKAVQFILFSSFHEEVNEVDTGAAERVAALEEEFKETYNPTASSDFLTFMKEANITLRAKIDVLNVFAILPPPDCWLDHIWRNVVQKGKEEHQVNNERFNEFIRYANSAMFAHVA